MPGWHPVDLLPGLWVGALAVLLYRGLRRWYDPVPAPVFAAFGLSLAILFGPVLFGGQILLPLDNLRGHVPFTRLPPTEPHGNILQGDLIELVAPSVAAAREAWADGRWPLWNPRTGAGMPLLADPQAQVLQPLVLLSYPFPWMRAAGVTAALRVLAALVFSFLWMRRLGLGAGPSLAGAFAFGLGGFVLLWLGWPIANPAALLPLVLYALARCRQTGGRRDLLLLAIGAFALLLGGHPETVLYAFAFALAVLLAQTLDGSDGVPRALRLRRLRDAALALLLAGAVAAPALLSTLDYLPQTLRAARLREPAEPPPATRYGADLARRWLPIAAPNAYGNSRFVHYWGLSNTNEDASGFVGTAALLTALLGLGARKRFPQERLALATVALCLIVLANPPGIDRVPLLASRRLLLPLSLCLAYLAACTLQRFRQGEARRWPVLLAGAGLAAVLAWAYLSHPNPEDPARLEVLRFGWLHWHMRFLVLAALLLALGRGRRWMPPAVAGLVAAELLLAHLPANPPMPKHLAFPVNDSIRFLRQNLGQVRMAALGRAFPPNLASLYGLSDARVYNPMAPRAYVELTAPITIAWWSEVPEFGAPRHPLYPRLGVRYLLTAPEDRLRRPLRLAHAGADASIWEIPDPLPSLFLRNAQGEVQLRRTFPERYQARLGLRTNGLLTSSVYQDGGWKVLVNRERVAAGTDGPFVAARLPAGRWRVDLLYRPRGFVAGCVLAAVGLALGMGTLTPRPPLPSALPSPGRGGEKQQFPPSPGRA
ncbi:MAG TPA: hypothetical protein VF756_21400 [Thermoanaerobaculia bacterium]